MIDFASALYLGMTHPAARLGDYAALTSGVPASLAASPQARGVAARAAELQGCEAGAVAPSTLHLAVDTFDRLARSHVLIADEALYPVMRWSLERVSGLGASLSWFAHGDPAALVRVLRRSRAGKPPAVITDATLRNGMPIAPERYLEAVASRDGLLVIDHSQVLGLLGEHPTPKQPWGLGGGGIAVHGGLGPSDPVLLLASWAKAFGVPLATLCGPAALVSDIACNGPTQSHCSAANQAALLAALDALDANRRTGDWLRTRLLYFVRRLRAGLLSLARTVLPDLSATLPLHPMQRIHLSTPGRTQALHASLRACGFRTALLHDAENRHAVVVIVRADHRLSDIDGLVQTMAATAPALPASDETLSKSMGRHHV